MATSQFDPPISTLSLQLCLLLWCPPVNPKPTELTENVNIELAHYLDWPGMGEVNLIIFMFFLLLLFLYIFFPLTWQ